MITRKMLKEWICEPDTERLDRLFDTPKRPIEVLTLREGEWAGVLDADRIEMLMQDGAIDPTHRLTFAADCAERALLRERCAGREPDPPRSWRGVEAAYDDPKDFLAFTDVEPGNVYEFTPLRTLPRVWYGTVPDKRAEWADGAWSGDCELVGPFGTKAQAKAEAEKITLASREEIEAESEKNKGAIGE